MSEFKRVTVSHWVFESILSKTGGKPQTTADGVRYFSFWDLTGRTVVYESPRDEQEKPS
jgi:hypothetical protein